MLLKLPHKNAALVALWLSSELGWSSHMVVVILTKCPQLFGLNPAATLGVKAVWFRSQGFETEVLSKMLYLHPQLLGYTIKRNESQLSALQALGLSKPQVAEMVRTCPVLLIRDISSDVTQAKIRFLTQVMGKSVQELSVCPGFLALSLVDRTGPRWAFHSLYCPGKPFILSTRLKCTELDFVRRLPSSYLDTECDSQGKSRLQLFRSFTAQWKEGEGRAWGVGNDSSSTDGLLGLSGSGDAGDKHE